VHAEPAQPRPGAAAEVNYRDEGSTPGGGGQSYSSSQIYRDALYLRNTSLSPQPVGAPGAVGEHHRNPHGPSGAAEGRLPGPEGRGGVPPGADGGRREEAGPGHGGGPPAQRLGDQERQETDDGAAGHGRRYGL